MTKYRLTLTNTTDGEEMTYYEDGFCNLFRLCKEFVLYMCQYAREYKLPRLKPEDMLETLVRDEELQYREVKMEIWPTDLAGK